MATRERRQRRSTNTTMALNLQLDAARRSARLEAMVLADEDGFTLATAGCSSTCDEIAARMPLIGRKVSRFHGVLFSPGRGWEIGMERFEAAGGSLFMCAIGGRPEHRQTQLKRSMRGATRILTTPASA